MYGKIYDMQDECRTQETGCTGNRNQMIEKEKKMLRQLSVFALLGICGMEDWKTKRIHIGWLLFFAAEGFLCSVCFWKRGRGRAGASCNRAVSERVCCFRHFYACGFFGRTCWPVFIYIQKEKQEI